MQKSNLQLAAAIHDVILTFPDGYRTCLAKRGDALRWAETARRHRPFLLKDPSILILDDATSSVIPRRSGDPFCPSEFDAGANQLHHRPPHPVGDGSRLDPGNG
jgi:hypothetical protein